MTNVKPLSDHPSDAELDGLRAGLYDDRLRERDALRAHLADCAACAARSGIWGQAKDALGLERPQLRNELRARRLAALAGEGVGHRSAPRWRLPMALAAGVAAVALALGVTLYTPDNSGDVQLAETEAPDLYTDIDFYLWLLQKQQEDMESSG